MLAQENFPPHYQRATCKSTRQCKGCTFTPKFCKSRAQRPPSIAEVPLVKARPRRPAGKGLTTPTAADALPIACGTLANNQ